LAGLAELATPACRLSVLDVRGNRLAAVAELYCLTGMASLRDLRVATPPSSTVPLPPACSSSASSSCSNARNDTNTLATTPDYVQAVLAAVPQLHLLDERPTHSTGDAAVTPRRLLAPLGTVDSIPPPPPPPPPAASLELAAAAPDATDTFVPADVTLQTVRVRNAAMSGVCPGLESANLRPDH
jgi:hypothetical protein